MVPTSKWSKTFFADLAERVGTTAIYGLIAVLTGDASGAVPNEPKVWWVIVGLPTALSLLKGLAANMADEDSGASLIPADDAERGEDGAVDTFVMIAVAALVLATLAIFGVRFG